MEFFDWLGIPQFFIGLFAQTADTAAEVVYKTTTNLYICLAVAAGLYLIGLIFGGIGLSTMAKKAGLKHSFLGFLPFANTWYAGKLAGEANFFGVKMKRAGLYAMILEIVYSALEVFLIVMNLILCKPEYYALTQIEDYSIWEIERSLIPENLRWQAVLLDYSSIVAYLLWIVLIVFLFILFTALFRKYYARGPVLMTLLCSLLPFRGFTLFAVRNNTPVDYNEYMRKRAQQYAQQRGYYGQGGYGGYNGGYGGNQGGFGGQNYGGGQGNNGGNNSAPEPFSDFGPSGTDGQSHNENDPFSDF